MKSSSPTKLFAGTHKTLHYPTLYSSSGQENLLKAVNPSHSTHLLKEQYLNSFLVANKFGECHVKVITYVLVLLLLVYQLICKEIDIKIDIKEISENIPSVTNIAFANGFYYGTAKLVIFFL